MNAPIAASPASSPVPPEAKVFATRPLRTGVRLEDTACFGDDVWNLLPAMLQKHKKTLQLDFTTIPAGFRLAIKEVFYAMLTADPPPGAAAQRHWLAENLPRSGRHWRLTDSGP